MTNEFKCTSHLIGDQQCAHCEIVRLRAQLDELRAAQAPQPEPPTPWPWRIDKYTFDWVEEPAPAVGHVCDWLNTNTAGVCSTCTKAAQGTGAYTVTIGDQGAVVTGDSVTVQPSAAAEETAKAELLEHYRATLNAEKDKYSLHRVSSEQPGDMEPAAARLLPTSMNLNLIRLYNLNYDILG